MTYRWVEESPFVAEKKAFHAEGDDTCRSIRMAVYEYGWAIWDGVRFVARGAGRLPTAEEALSMRNHNV